MTYKYSVLPIKIILKECMTYNEILPNAFTFTLLA